MKKYIAGLLLVLLVVSCTTKKEEKLPVEDMDYISRPIGINKDGEYSIIDVDTLSNKWNSDIHKKLQLSGKAALTDFKIVKTKTQGDAVENCYLIVGHTDDGSISMSSIVYLKDDKFYFETRETRGQKAGEAIICRARYGGANCNPIVVLSNKGKHLICSSSEECEKTVREVY